MELFREKAFELMELMDSSLPTVSRLRYTVHTSGKGGKENLVIVYYYHHRPQCMRHGKDMNKKEENTSNYALRNSRFTKSNFSQNSELTSHLKR